MILLEPSQVLNEVDTSKTKTINIGTSLDVPTGCHSDAFKSLIDIPSNDTNCTGVDRKNGFWFHCNVCNTEVKCLSVCPFPIWWNQHIKPCSAHCKKLEQVDSIAEIKKKSKIGKNRTALLSSYWTKSIFTCFFNLEIEQNWDCFAQKWYYEARGVHPFLHWRRSHSHQYQNQHRYLPHHQLHLHLHLPPNELLLHLYLHLCQCKDQLKLLMQWWTWLLVCQRSLFQW